MKAIGVAEGLNATVRVAVRNKTPKTIPCGKPPSQTRCKVLVYNNKAFIGPNGSSKHNRDKEDKEEEKGS